MRRHRNRRKSNQSKVIIPSVICLLVVMTIGYAAFNTQLSVNVKGNIAKKKAAQQLIANVVDNGDGLYVDTVEEGRYIYRGANPDNYITFNDENSGWRIISVESDGTLKIIRNEQLSSTYAWDTKGTRSSSTSTYCTRASDYGCDAWAATSNLVGTPSTFIQYYPQGNPTSYTETYTGTVTGDASLNTYLNGTYYNILSTTAQSQIVKGTFNVSTPGRYNDTETLDVDAEQEKQYQWKGYVALMNVTELLRASTSGGCTSINVGWNSNNSSTCSIDNWLWPTFNTSNHEWTLSPDVVTDRAYVLRVYSDGYIYGATANLTYGVRPVVFLSADITLSGEGTESQPYTIN